MIALLEVLSSFAIGVACLSGAVGTSSSEHPASKKIIIEQRKICCSSFCINIGDVVVSKMILCRMILSINLLASQGSRKKQLLGDYDNKHDVLSLRAYG